MKPVPLRLALDPLLPTRAPLSGDCFRLGYRLRLPGGPVVRAGDRLLAAFGASVEWIEPSHATEEPMQSEAFDPGRVVHFAPEPLGPDEPDGIGVWDAEAIHLAGILSEAASATVFAATDVGLEQRGLVLSEERSASDDRRERISVLVYPPRLVRVGVPRTPRYERVPRNPRPRLVLVASTSGDVRWWDPSATAGPAGAADIPLSDELRRELESLRDAYAELNTDFEDATGFDRIECAWARDELQCQALSIWRRARSELGPRYALGFLGVGMKRPVWSPSELSGTGAADDEPDDAGEEDEIPF